MIVPPQELAERPASSTAVPGPPLELADPPHDLLSQLLRSVRLRGERVAEQAPDPGFDLPFTGVGHLLFVDAGPLALRVDADPEVRHVGPGDIVLLPRGDAHRVGDAAGAAARWLSGTFTIGDPQASHLLGSLPAVIVLSGADGGPAMEGLEVARRMLLLEMQAPSQGSAVMVARILDLIFIQVLRLWAAGSDAEPNWMAGALDPYTGRALSAIHRDPGHDWTVDELARVCNLSRSAFAARFVAHVGKPPATYLAHVRLDAATALLRESPLPVAVVAKKVGYSSEAAFSRAFKSRYGVPPVQWRRAARAHGQPAGGR